MEEALGQVREADAGHATGPTAPLREAPDRKLVEVAETQRKAAWLIEQRRAAPEQGPLAVRRAELQGELAAERRAAERRAAEESAQRVRAIERLRARRAADIELAPRATRLAEALASAGEAMGGLLVQMRSCSVRTRRRASRSQPSCARAQQEEAEIQGALRVEGEAVTHAEVAAQRLRDQASEAQEELRGVCERLELPAARSHPPPKEGDASEQTEEHAAGAGAPSRPSEAGPTARRSRWARSRKRRQIAP